MADQTNNDAVLEMLENINDGIKENSDRLDALEDKTKEHSESLEERAVGIIEGAEHPKNIYETVQNTILGGILIVVVVAPIMISRYGKRDKKIQTDQLKIEKANYRMLRRICNHHKIEI